MKAKGAFRASGVRFKSGQLLTVTWKWTWKFWTGFRILRAHVCVIFLAATTDDRSFKCLLFS